MMSIPKRAHWIWLHEETPSWALENIETFKALHPSWEFRIWHELPEEFPDDLRTLIDTLPWYSSRSDIFRYWLLSEHGGVYLDTDIITLRNFESLLDCDFFLAPCQPTGHTEPHLACGLMGSAAGSRPASKVLEACRQRAFKESEPRRITYGPDLLTDLFADDRSEVRILPLHYFYVIPDRETTHRFWRANDSTRNGIMRSFESHFTDAQPPYAVHLWGVNGSSQRKVETTSSKPMDHISL